MGWDMEDNLEDIKGADINAVLFFVKSLARNVDTRYGILAMALVIGCKGMGVSREDFLRTLEEAYDREIDLIPLGQAMG